MDVGLLYMSALLLNMSALLSCTPWHVHQGRDSGVELHMPLSYRHCMLVCICWPAELAIGWKLNPAGQLEC